MAKKKLVRYGIWFFVLLVATVIATHLGRTAVKGQEKTAIIIAAIVFISALIFKLGLPPSEGIKKKSFLPWVSLPILGLALWAANSRLFGKFDVGATLFHMQHSLKYDGLKEDILEFLIFTLLASILIICIRYLGDRDHRVRWIDKVTVLPLLIINPITSYAYDSYLNPSSKDISLIDYYVQPDLTLRKAEPKNVVILYLESIEDSYSNAAFGDSFKTINDISKQGLRLDGVKEIQDTGWTIAGITASQCGIPLLSYGLIMKNRMKNIETFLPGTQCLAEVLKKDGYNTVFYGGANLNFAGKGTFLKTHGYDELKDTKQFPKDLQASVNEWGLHDEILLDLALDKMEQLQSQDAPYLLSVLTFAGHAPKGYPSPSCYDVIPNAEEMDSLLLTIRCTGYLTQKFLKQAAEKGLLNNTLVVLMSDHLAHRNSQYRLLSKLDRQNFALLIAPDITPGVKTVNGGMIDMYPTILDAIGYDLNNNRVGLGTSFLEKTPTLRETVGPNKLDKAILRDTALRRHVWDLDAAANFKQ